MIAYKEKTKKVLASAGIYEIAHRVWVKRLSVKNTIRNTGFRIAGSFDGLPVPPARYIELVTTGRQICGFLHGGKLCHESILFTLRRNGFKINEFKSILDFGCGCGRVLRYWKSISGPEIHGTDYNPELISWCIKYLGDFAHFKTNNPVPPLDYEPERFEFVYAISVFTHLSQDLQHNWMDELYRILRPNGLLLITVHGENRLHQLTSEEQEQFKHGQLVVNQENFSGTNICAAYHPEVYIRSQLAKNFEVLDFIMVGARDSAQDIYLLKKSTN